MKICPLCHKKFKVDGNFCPKDGTPLMEISDPLIGEVLLGQFEITEVIGQGAMGKVYLARQLSIDRNVAVKVLKNKLANDQKVVKRFNREAKAAARLNHPNIITIHLVGQIKETGTPYMVMEYADGSSLELVCKAQGIISEKRVFNIIRDIASALDEAHKMGVVHRDLKPDNISIINMGTPQEKAKVLDFGIAKILHTDEEISQLTKTGTIFGTPAYISPEQASGERIDYRSDLYSLGVIMFRLATGRLPFDDASGLEILVRHIKDSPPLPSTLNPNISTSLEKIIIRLLCKDPDERYVSAQALIDVLDECQGNTNLNSSGSRQYNSQNSVKSSGNLTSSIKGQSPQKDSFDFDNGNKNNNYKIFLLLFVGLSFFVGLIFILVKYISSNHGDSSTQMTAISSKPAISKAATKVQVNKQQTPPKQKLTTPKVGEICEFEFNKSEKQRLNCGSSILDIEVKRQRRRRYILEIYFPGTSLENCELVPVNSKSSLRFWKRKYLNQAKDKMQVTLRVSRSSDLDFFVKNKEQKIARVNIDYASSSSRRKNRKGSRKKDKNKEPEIVIPDIEDIGSKDKPADKIPSLPSISPMEKDKDNEPKLPSLPEKKDDRIDLPPDPI
ncbi:MAG: serine/threonine-protein kinase [Deltaproteobacteria bacterium]|jgi:serine/threonine protein kinase|nr:serine/threonine-protein kinase [Deltaproteobacteria bacterium]